MINDNEKVKYEEFNKIYIPSDYISDNYSYRFDNDYIMIITNNNCYTQYSSTYCNCYRYNWKTNVMSNVINCNTNSNLAEIPRESISEDINYSRYIKEQWIWDKGIYLGIFILGILLAAFLTRERSSY